MKLNFYGTAKYIQNDSLDLSRRINETKTSTVHVPMIATCRASSRSSGSRNGGRRSNGVKWRSWCQLRFYTRELHANESRQTGLYNAILAATPHKLSSSNPHCTLAASPSLSVLNMKIVHSLVLLSCALWEANGYPYTYYPSYGNMDSCKNNW